MKKIVGKSHPNIFGCYEGTGLYRDKTEQFESAAASFEEKICRDRRIRTLFDTFQNGEYSLADYIASVRH